MSTKDRQPSPSELMADMTQHLAKGGADVVPADDTPPVIQRSYGLDYASLAAGPLATIEGFDLVKGENKHTLIGVPFIIVGVTYRPGISQETDRKVNYVSVELVTADSATLNDRVAKGRVTDRAGTVLTEPLIGANETLVINDGGTGIARQVTEYLHIQGHISVGAITADTITGGEMGTSPYDRYFEEWPMGADIAGKGIKLLPPRMPLHCPRGLRVSEYPNPRNPKTMSYTYYLG